MHARRTDDHRHGSDERRNSGYRRESADGDNRLDDRRPGRANNAECSRNHTLNARNHTDNTYERTPADQATEAGCANACDGATLGHDRGRDGAARGSPVGTARPEFARTTDQPRSGGHLECGWQF